MAHAKKASEGLIDPLDVMLARLQLSGIRDISTACSTRRRRANLSARETLIPLCEREIARKDHHRIEMALKLAHFLAVKELAGFDFEAQPSIDPKQIRDLAGSRWIANGENVLLLDPPGDAGARRLERPKWWYGRQRDACGWYASCIRAIPLTWKARMLTAIVLICSVSLTPDLADCSPENARAAIRVPAEFANPVTCLMQSQAFLAETSVGEESDYDDRVKIVCARREPVSAMK
jgi:hypothetical protein